jgi:hypothetical protein
VKSLLLRGALLGAAVVVLCARTSAAQTTESRSLSGTVVLGDRPVQGVPVTLHRVTPDESGPLASGVTTPDGGFAFSLPPADSVEFEVFVVTAEYLSVRYFGQPVHGGAAPEVYSVAVFDTTSALVGAVAVARRDIVLIPQTEGGWEANEIIRLHNSADRTLVSRGGLPVWEMELPEGITDFQAGEGEMTASEVARMGDRVMLVASLLPGDRELFVRYRIPPSLETANLPIGTATDTFNIFVGQPSPAVEIAGLETTRVVDVQGERFVQYGTTDLAAGDEISLRWDAPEGPPVAPEIAGSVAALVVLLVGSWFAARARGRSDAGSAASAPAG